MLNDPIIICGAHGGGTSFITKLLRKRGFFSGIDSCNINERKTHESKSLNDINRNIIKLMAISGKYNSGRTNKVIEEYENFFKKKSLVSSIMRKIIQWKVNNFDFKIYFDGEDSLKLKSWGWKDPRNSITLKFWLKRFPKAKIIAIQKTRDNEKSKSNSGDWFKQIATKEVINFYQNPRGITKDNKIFYVKFEEVLRSYNSFNQLLDFCSLPKLKNTNEFEKLLRNADFEK